ncbi:MAG: TonB-dependent receptor [Bacteroidetes bacterium]|nr:TonB-dependent receptor [Bacteroidota bacterium]
MKKVFLLPALFYSLNLFSQAPNQDTIKNQELDPVVIVGDRAKYISGSGQYINILKIEKLNQPNVNNVLRIVPGVNVRDEEGFGLRPNIGLRGTPVNRSAKITLMEDGILIAPAPYADPAAYYFPTFSRMQGIEVLKGSSQIKYGPYTVGGAINLLSTVIPNTFKGFAQVGLGSFGTNQQRIWVGDSRKNIDYVFEINRIASNGFKVLPNGENTGFDRRDVMGKIRWHTDEDAKIAQSVMLKMVASVEDGNETYLGLTYEDFQTNRLGRYAATQKDILDMNHNHLSLTHTISPVEGLKFHTTAYYSFTYRDWARVNSIVGQSLNNILQNPASFANAYQVMTGKANGAIDYQSAERTFFSKGIQTNAQYLFVKNDWTHKIQFGMRYHLDQADRFATRSAYNMTNGTMILFAAGIKGNQENQIRNAQSLATFLNYDISFKRLKVSPGVRYENINFDFQNYGTADNARLGTGLRSAENQLTVILPGIGLHYWLNENMNLLGGIHKGFSPPGMPSVTATSGQARMETSVNYELGYHFEKNGYTAQVVGFFNNYSNILGSDNISGGGLGTGDMFNAGNAHIRGIEISFEGNLLSNKNYPSGLSFPVSLAYTFTDARFQETFINGGGDWGTGRINQGDRIPFITPHLLTANVGVSNQKFDLTLSSRFTGITRVKPGAGALIIPDNVVKYADVNALAGFLIIDLSTNYDVTKSVTAFATINNLTNSKAIVANLPQGYRPNMPLSFNTGLKIRF